MPSRRVAATLAAALLLTPACSSQEEPPPPPASPVMPPDLHSAARPMEVRVTHMELDWKVLFDQQSLAGTVTLHLERGPDWTGQPLRLDSRDLEIRGAQAGLARGVLAPTTWRAGEADPILGTPILVDLPEGADRVRLAYRTRPEATGLQWLAPEQTAGGRHPFLYSQAQAIHARSFVPCQDTPGVRITFDAVLRVDPPLRAVMAAAPAPAAGGDGPGVFRFRMEHPVPTYLLALAAGDLTFGETGPRTGVWSEPPLLTRSVSEFADMEPMLQAAERLYGPYRWGRYDLLVLPPFFPFGGMENPTLTFLTPTVLAGDRSLVALVAHELAHSWSGNLVTNATWSDFWLNEGFTTYIQQRIMEEVYGPEVAEMHWVLGRRDLDQELAAKADAPGDQVLHIDLSGRDPDDGMNDIPYEKGALFLRLLEETYGRETFDGFLRRWFNAHAFTSVTTGQFRAYLEENLLAAHQPLPGRQAPGLDDWLEQPGLPASAPSFTSAALARVDAALAAWVQGATPAARLDTAGWTTQHWLHFLDGLPGSLTPAQMAELDAAFGFTGTGNAEVLDRWLVLAIRHGHAAADRRLEEFLTSQGRRKFLTPLYEELMKTPEGASRARRLYRWARPRYHAIARRTLDAIVGQP